MSYVSTDIKKIIAEIIENKKEKGGVKNIYFVGCGGSLGALYPAKTFMEREAQVLRSAWINSNEFVHSTPKDFGENSIICLACHKGNTPETIQAAKLGKEKGAAVIILTWLEESEIIEFGDYIIRYTFDASLDHLAGDIDYAGEKTQCALLVAVELLAQTEGYENYEKFYEGLGMISNIIKNARKHVAERAEAFAEEYKNDSVIYTMGSGASYGAAYMESICIFMEMQWLDSSSIHTGEYFHGPFEITDANRPFMIQISEGTTRELDERALTFLKKYAKRIEVLGAVSGLVPTLADGSKLPLTTVIEIFMLVAAAAMILLTKLDSNKVLDQPVFRTGMFAVVLAFGLCWLVNTFIGDQSSFITDNMSALTNKYPWIFIVAVFIVGAITTSQSSTTMIMIPIGIALGLPANVIVAGWIACSSNYFIPASGQCVAALAFDSAGTTKIGKFVLNHSYMIPGLVCTVVSVVVALLIGAVVF